MSRELTIAAAVLVAVGLYLLIHRVVVTRATQKVHQEALSQTKAAIQAALQRLVDDRFIDRQAQILTSTALMDGWGRGVMTFEFVLGVPITNDEQLQIFRQQLNRTLSDFTQNHKIRTANQTGTTAFLVTDIWRHDTRVHLNVAYLVNEATIEYLKDLHKVDQMN